MPTKRVVDEATVRVINGKLKTRPDAERGIRIAARSVGPTSVPDHHGTFDV